MHIPVDSLAMAVARRRSTASSVATNCARSRISNEFGVQCSRMEIRSGADDEEDAEDNDDEEEDEDDDDDEEEDDDEDATLANAELTRATHAAPEPGRIGAPLPLLFRFGMSSASRLVASSSSAEFAKPRPSLTDNTALLL